MKLIPYLYFEGNCEEAIDYYRVIFEGNVPYKDFYGSAPMEVPEIYKYKILHCQLDFGNNSIMACDTFPGGKINNGNGIVLSVGFENEDRATNIFNNLAVGGRVTMPFEKQFWGAYLGQVTDRFGKIWMISTNLDS
ncbi:VOC family protein [Dyadobacter psychrotolerans]|uniref:VOC family protein n=1 Tax=Dyadobacter psychrotolerans TaxID=2541721 RepID=A0A4R5DLD0_9BACT|nr:VOC family protein [Dyadobacter psychrotolerans]TDE12834.1 VOC family protein [Dyadobacter psychrotolerans]